MFLDAHRVRGLSITIWRETMKARVWGKLFGSLAVLFAMVLAANFAHAKIIDFENGIDRTPIRSTITGLEFTTTDGYDWVYADWRAGTYCGPCPYLPAGCGASYFSDGNFFAWLGENQGRGVITFTASYATYVKIGYSADSGLTIEAYDSTGSMVDSASGAGNLNTCKLDELRVDAPGMAYVIIHDTGNYWLIDNLDTDALQDCLSDPDCDDGVACNGKEICASYICQKGTPLNCPDDGLFCNGTESCDESAGGCTHSGSPCKEGETCNEDKDTCEKGGGPGDEGPGSLAGGGCGCTF